MNSSALDLNLLAALDALLTERNVTKAAKRLNISQPALSARLGKLRTIFGDALLIPSRRGMIATQRALELQAPLRLALDQLRSIARMPARFNPATAKETISIAASDYMQSTLLLPMLAGIRRRAPLLKVALHLIDGARVWEQMERADIDIAMMTPENAPPLLRSRQLWSERYVCIARAGHPKARQDMSPAAFSALDHVVVSPRGSGFVGAADAALKECGLARKVFISVNSFLLVPQLVSKSDLVALIPERLIANDMAGLQTFPPPIDVPGFSIAMVWHDRTTSSPCHLWLRRKIVASARRADASGSRAG